MLGFYSLKGFLECTIWDLDYLVLETLLLTLGKQTFHTCNLEAG